MRLIKHAFNGGFNTMRKTLRMSRLVARQTIGILLMLSTTVFAADLPTGGVVVSGSGRIDTPDAGRMRVEQASDKLIVDWQSFDIGKDMKVQFAQPGAASVALNRVLGSDGSSILGVLEANGRIFLVNPNGVLFGANAQVDVGGLVASTLGISNEDFIKGNYRFTGAGGEIRNLGNINIKDGGAVALLGGRVVNDGVIVAKLGNVALASGKNVTLDFAGDGLLKVEIAEGLKDALVANHQMIVADGGQVILTAQTADALLQTVVNNTGVIRAQTLEDRAGRIVLLGDLAGGEVKVGGKLDATAPAGGKGGFIETSGATVRIAEGTKVNAGEWLIDPVNQTIDAAAAATLSGQLATGNATVTTAGAGTDEGNIDVNAAIGWSTGNTLTLTADNDINVNADITATGDGQLAMNFGGDYNILQPTRYAGTERDGAGNLVLKQAPEGTEYASITLAGASAGLKINGDDYTLIHSMAELDALDDLGTATGNYALAENLDAAGTTYTDPLVYSFDTGTFTGLGHTIDNLTIASGSYTGLFGFIGDAGWTYATTIRDLGVTNASIVIIGNYAGILSGYLYGNASNVWTTGSISGGENTGGLVGYMRNGSITGSIASSNVSGSGYTGGLVGEMYDSSSIADSSASGDVSGEGNFVGGLAGYMQDNGSITGSIASSNVSGSGYTGGLVGEMYDSSSIADSIASGDVSGAGNFVGGLIGYMQDSNSITGSIASSNVSGSGYTGGLVGYMYNSNSITDSSASGDVTGAGIYVGGLVGEMYNSSITGSIASGDVSGNHNTGGLVGYMYNSSSIADSSASGTVAGNRGVGGLAGSVYSSSITDSSASGDVTGAENYAGGLAGYVDDSSITDSSASGDVTGAGIYVGGLAGWVASGSSITGSSASGDVTGENDYAGGLVGILRTNATVRNSWASGDVAGVNAVGGLVGYNDGGNSGNNSIEYAYATGDVAGVNIVGGFVGFQGSSPIYQGYSSGKVTGNSYVGGFIGDRSWAEGVLSSYWNTETSGLSAGIGDGSTAAGLTGLTTAEMQAKESFTGWDIATNGGGADSIWRIYEGHTAPLLRSFLTPLTVEVDVAKVYDGAPNADNVAYTTSAGDSLDATQLLGNGIDLTAPSKNVGVYIKDNGLDVASDLYSTQTGYDIFVNSNDARLTVTPRGIGVSVAAEDKTYDGTTVATVTGTPLGIIAGDTVTFSGTGAFDNKNVGTDKTVTVTGGLLGTDSGNYTATFDATTLADILAKAINVEIAAANKTYDGTTVADVTGTPLEIIAGDDVTFGGTGAFGNKNAGTGKTVNVTGGLFGVDAGNYIATFSPTTLADILAKAITATFTTQDKVYDGTTVAEVSGALDAGGVIAGDTVNLSGTGTFDNKNVGTGKTVTFDGSLEGADADNYTVTFNQTALADIFAKAINVSVAAANKTYDGTTVANVTGTPTGVIAGDDVTFGGSGTFDTKIVGTGKTVTVTGGLLGADAGNYTATFSPTTLADILARAITATFTAQDKVYDGTTVAEVAGVLDAGGVLAGDTVTFNGSGAFDDKNAGTGKTVNVTGGLLGADAGNYTATFDPTTLADIFTKAITATFTAQDKVYDGTTVAEVAGVLDTTGVIAGDTVNLSGTGTFDNKNVGTGKTVTFAASLEGTDAENYTVTFNQTALADIFAKAINVSVAAANKTYDGTTVATVTGTPTGIIDGDVVTFNGTGTFDNKNAGTGKTVTVTGGLLGADAGNYTATFDATTLANILAKAISVEISAANKTYDGTTVATVTGTPTGVINGDAVTFSGTGVFDNKNVGTGKTVNVTGGLLGADSGNYTATFDATTLADIFAKAITATFTAQDKVYDGTTVAEVSGVLDTAGVIAGDTVTLIGAGAFDNKNAGTGKTVTVAGALLGADAGNYTVTFDQTALADIFAKAINVSVAAANKTYDGSTSATVTGTPTGVIAGDAVTFNGTGVFDDKNVGTGKTVNVTGSLLGADAGNYTATFDATTLANILAKAISVEISAANKTYDGTTVADVTGTPTGVIDGDAVTFNGTGIFDDKNAGTGKTVNVTGGLLGADSGNYTATFDATTLADIFAKAITATFTAQDKVYDGTTVAEVAGVLDTTGILAGDTVNLSGTGTFDNKNVGTGKTVTVSGSLLGTDAENYTVTFNQTALADIFAKAINVSVAAANKTYDGTTVATVTGTPTGIINGDAVTFSGTGTFDNKNAGTGKTVTVTGGLLGEDAENYTATFDATTLANILAKAINVEITAANKTYDGTTVATVTGTPTGVIAGDTVTFNGTGSFDNKNAGTGKTVNVTGGLLGADAGNYTATFDATTLANIFAKAITATFTAQDKVYDGTTVAEVAGVLDTAGVLAGDTVTLIGTGEFDNKNVGTGKTVTFDGSLLGADAENYTVTFDQTALADIFAKAINVSVAAANKTYDGTTVATVTGTPTGVIAGDDVTFDGTGVFDDKNVGTGKTVNVTGGLLGEDAGNYTATFDATTLANILAKAISVEIAAANKTYDGTTVATATGTPTGVIAGDAVTFSGTGTFDNKNAGTGKTVTVTGGLLGADAGNYTVTFNQTALADIFAKAINVSVAAANKTYDGTTVANVTGTPTGIIAGDAVTFNGTGTFDNKNAGTGKTVTVTGALLGADAGNYTATFDATTLANILAKAINVEISAANKTYDGTTVATVTGTPTGVIDGDVVTFNGTGVFDNKNAGTGKTVNVTGSLLGADAENYTATFDATTLANILAKAINVEISAANKTYDGTTVATVTGTPTGVIAGDTVTFNGTGAFDNKNAGTGKTVNVTGGLLGADAGNYTATISPTTLANIFAKAISVSVAAANKTYDGTTVATVTGTPTGVLAGDTVTFNGTGTFDNKNAGTGKTVTVSGSLLGADAGNYTVTFDQTALADIFAKAINVSVAAANKTYDGTTVANVTGTPTGVIDGDAVTFSGTGVFDDKNVGTGKTVSVDGSLLGTDAGNYTATFDATTLADILAKAISVEISAANKTYDGTTVATVTGTPTGVIAGDTVTFSGTGAFDNKNAGTGKTVNVTGSLLGTDAGNYTATFDATTLANILAKAINVEIAAANKTYDGTTVATVTGTPTGVLAGDTVTFNGTGTFDNKNAGTGKTVTVSGSLLGADAGNYTATFDATTLANILAKAINVEISAANKTYDGTTVANVTGTPTGVIDGDVVTFNGTGAFDNKNAGSGKTVNVAGSLLGADAGNYTATFDATTLANILAKAISVEISAANKTYDGTTVATVTGTPTGVIAGDTVTFNGTGAFDNKNAGTGKTVNVTGGLLGADAGNYTATISPTTLANIFAKAISVSVAAANKTYDGTTVATVTGTPTGVLAGDTVTFSGTGVFDDKNAGTGKTVNVTGGLLGADSGNYTATFDATTLADIFAKAINVEISAANKTYDGTTVATVTGTPTGVFAGDTVTFNGTGVFDNKNVGTGKTVTVTGGLLGADAGNYTATFDATTLANILAKAINVEIAAANKTYDGTTVATVTGTPTGVINGDTVTFNGTGAFDNKNAGTGKTVTVTGALLGTDAGNYTATFDATTLANILAKAINVGISAANKTYDGTTVATVTGTPTGVIAGDAVTFNGTGVFDNKNVGTGKTVNVTGGLLGADAGNYTVTFDQTALADIFAKAINVEIAAANKTYDGTTIATVTGTPTGVIAGDAVTFNGTGAFDNKNAGTGKTVTVSGSLLGADAGNYTATFDPAVFADVLAKAITGVFTAANKTYDGSIAATVTGTLQGVVAEDNVALGGTGTFSDSGVGRGKTVAITGGLLGADAGNYTVAFNTTAQADILADPVSDGYDAALGSAQKLSSSNSSQSVGYVSRQNRLVEAGGADRSDAATLVGCDESGCASYVVIDGGINIPTSNR